MMRGFLVALPVFLLACGGASPSTDGLRDAQRLSADLGSLEEDALALTEGLSVALKGSPDAEAALEALAQYIETNRTRMFDVSGAIAERFREASDDDYTSYHQVFSDSMTDATFAWLDACIAFIEDHPDHEQALREVVSPLGPLRIPDPEVDD